MTAHAATRDLERRFGDLKAVDGVSLEVHPGEIVGLLGANGAGKTTLIRMLLGLLAPSGGHVFLFGSSPGRAVRRRLGYMPQGLGLYDDLTVRENLSFAADVFGVERPPLADLVEVADVLVADLPLGLRRRAAFANAIGHRPELLVLDEPTSGVGPLARAELWDIIHSAADAGTAVLVTTHHMDEAEQCDRLVVMAAGRTVAEGTVAAIVGDLATVEVEAPDPLATLSVLEEAGIVALPAGRRLRLPGVGPDEARSLLGEGIAVETSPANLEEAFMVLSRAGR